MRLKWTTNISVEKNSNSVNDFKVTSFRGGQNVLENLDHKYLNEIDFFIERASSAEYIALYIFGEVEKQMKGKKAILKKVQVWESDMAYASYER